MRRHSRFWLAGALILAAAVSIQAQEGRGNGRLTGTVVDEKGAPMESVKITLKYLEFNNTRETKSNPKGQWGFLGLGKGTVEVSGEMEGYITAITQQPVSGAAPNPEMHLVLRKNSTPGADKNRDLIMQANELFDNRQYTEALALYQEFAQKNPTNYKTGIYIANCRNELREYDAALAEFQKVLDEVVKETPDLKGNTTAAQAYAGIGDIYLRQQKFDLAEKNFRLSIEIQPSDPALPYNVAEIMFVQNKIDDAEKYYQLAIQIKPEWPKPYLKMAYVSLNKGQMDKALEFLKKYCELGKDDVKYAEGKALLDSLSAAK